MQLQLVRPTAAFGASSRTASRGRAAAGRRLQISATANRPSGGEAVRREVERFFQRYDCLSAGMGSLAVTSYCVWRGQDPWTALSITFTATIAALVINEVIDASQSRR